MRFRGQEVALEPRPDPRQRRAGDAARNPVGKFFVDKKRLDRQKKTPIGRVEALVGLAGGALLGAQFIEDEIEAGKRFTRQRAPLELAQKQRARFRRHLAKILPQPLDRRGPAAHSSPLTAAPFTRA